MIEYSKVAPDGVPELFFGYLVSPLGPDCDELCYLTLGQIRELRVPRLGLPIETDLYWRPIRLADLKARLYPTEDEDEIDPSTAAVLALEAEGKGYAYAGEPTQLSLF